MRRPAASTSDSRGRGPVRDAVRRAREKSKGAEAEKVKKKKVSSSEDEEDEDESEDESVEFEEDEDPTDEEEEEDEPAENVKKVSAATTPPASALRKKRASPKVTAARPGSELPVAAPTLRQRQARMLGTGV